MCVCKLFYISSPIVLLNEFHISIFSISFANITFLCQYVAGEISRYILYRAKNFNISYETLDTLVRECLRSFLDWKINDTCEASQEDDKFDKGLTWSQNDHRSFAIELIEINLRFVTPNLI